MDREKEILEKKKVLFRSARENLLERPSAEKLQGWIKDQMNDVSLS